MKIYYFLVVVNKIFFQFNHDNNYDFKGYESFFSDENDKNDNVKEFEMSFLSFKFFFEAINQNENEKNKFKYFIITMMKYPEVF